MTRKRSLQGLPLWAHGVTVSWLAGSKPSLNMCSEHRWQDLGTLRALESLSFSGSFCEQESDKQKSRLLPSEAEGHLKGRCYLAVYFFMKLHLSSFFLLV